jgi:hypothetical protein
MTGQEAGDRLARLLLPYRVRDHDDAEDPDHEAGWWFRATPPEVVREALTLVHMPPGCERPNDQPPEEWLVAQAECGGGVLAGFVAPAGPASPRMRVDAIIVPVSQADDLADEIARLWPVDHGACTALDLAIVEGLATAGATRHLWDAPGSEFASWRADVHDWLDAAFCSFWWD